MDKRILKSSLVLAVVGLLGFGATYAQLTSNTVTISDNTISVPDAQIKICDNTANSGDGWDTALAGFSIASLAPGDSAELTLGKDIVVGNDNGDLATAGSADGDANSCASYDATAENSGVDLDILPIITPTSCGGTLETDLTITLELDAGGAVSKTLADWSLNSDTLGPTIAPGSFEELTVDVELASDSTDAEESCTFDIELTGQQAITI